MKLLVCNAIGLLRRNIRNGFLIVALVGASVVGSTLWATIAMLPYLQARSPQLVMSPLIPTYNARLGVPSELAWFFIQYAYISSDVRVRAKNHHTFIITDGSRRREYVVTVGQSSRRVEIYFADSKKRSTVHVFTPGKKRLVELQGSMVIQDETRPDPNLWIWRTPLWNAQHLKIYALADFWLDAPYKKFSCSGFVHRFLKDAGIKVPILDAWDLAKQPWMRVTSDELEPGDIITIRAATERHRRFWKHRITHVGVYLGNGKLIHAATASIRARRSYIRVATLDQFRGRIDKILRPPDLL